MTTKQLIEELEKLNQDLPVRIFGKPDGWVVKEYGPTPNDPDSFVQIW